MPQVDWTVFGPLVAKMLADFLAAERARKGLTNEEIFTRAGLKLDENERKLLADIARLTGKTGGVAVDE